MWNRRQWTRCLASGLLGATLPAVRAQVQLAVPPAPARSPLSRVAIAVENRSAFCYLPLTVAERLGYFAAEGIDVQIRELAEPGQALQALLTGAVPVLSGTYGSVVSLRARGETYPSIVVQGRAPQLVLGVSRRSLGGYRDLRDLNGRKIAVTGFGTGSHRMIQTLLSGVRLRAEQVRLIPLADPHAALAGFRNGDVDAICYTDPVITELEQGGELKVVADTRTVRGNAEVFGGPMPGGCLSVSSDYLARHPEECQGMVNAMVRALKWLQTAGPSDINKTVPEYYFHGDRALYLAAFSRAREAWSTDGVMPEGGPNTVARVVTRFDPASPLKAEELAQTFTNALALKAKARFKA